MFTKTAEYYDAIYQFKDYDAECKELATFIKDKNPQATTLLDVACGTGKHLAFLKEYFVAEGLDLNEDLLAIASERCPGVPFHPGDMTALQLDKTYDVI
ncbi:MAG: class I SAM-dependent methyltransferase, partial [Chitinophagaceae bacterium]